MKRNMFITHIRWLIAKGVVIDSLSEKVKELSKSANITLSKNEVKYILNGIAKTDQISNSKTQDIYSIEKID